MVIFTADHGEEFYEHGEYSHGNKLYDELIHVPLIVNPPDEPRLNSVKEPVPLLNIAPTLTEAGGTAVEDFMGESFLRGGDYILGDEGWVISEADLGPNYKACVRSSNWKYIHSPDGGELYNLTKDPQERQNVADKQPSVVNRAEQILLDHRSRVQGISSNVTLDDNLRERLRTLGYL